MFSERRELLKILRGTPVVLEGLTAGITDDAARARPAEGEWAIVEVVAHMGDTDERALERVRRMLAEEHPLLPGYDQEALAVERRYIEMDLRDALTRFATVRDAHVTLLESLDDAGWRRTGRHAEQGPMDVGLYVHHTAGDDVDHLAQIARMVTAARGGATG